MKRLFAFAILVVFAAAAFAVQAAPAEKKEALALTVKDLYSTPSESANLIYKIPIEVTLLDLSNDGNWYKVRIAYNIGPFSYTYVGWANIPVGKIMAERNASQIAQVPAEE